MPSAYSLFTNFSFDATKNKLNCYRGKDCINNCYRGKDCISKDCIDLREHAMKIVDYEKKEMMPPTYKENKL